MGTLFCVIWDRRKDARVVCRRRALTAATPRRRGRRTPTYRSASAAPRACGRDGTEGIPLSVIQRQLGHANLGITSVYLQGIDQRWRVREPGTFSVLVESAEGNAAPQLDAG